MANTTGKETATPEAIYRVILDSDEPVLTNQQIADEIGVSAQTVRNHIDEVVEYNGVHSRKIGRTRVYWYEEEETIVDFEYTTDLGINVTSQILLEARTEYLQAKQYAHSHLAADTSDPQVRVWLWEMIYKYLTRSQVYEQLEFTMENGYEVDPSSRWAKELGEDVLRYYVGEHHFFTVPEFGEVSGLDGLESYETARAKSLAVIAAAGELPDHSRTADEELDEYAGRVVGAYQAAVGGAPPDACAEDVEMDQSRISNDDLDELYPSVSELLGAGETIDHLVTSVYDIRW